MTGYWVPLLFGQAPPAIPPELGGLMAGGGGLAVFAGVVVWLLRSQKEEIKELTSKYTAAVADLQLALTRKDEQIMSQFERMDKLAREIQADNQRRDTNWVALNREVVGALENVTSAMGTMREGLTEVKQALQGMDQRIEHLERPRGGRGGAS